MPRRFVVCCLGAALAAQQPAPAPAPARAPTVTRAPAPAPTVKPAIRHDATTMIVDPGRHELRDLVEATARFLQRNILPGDLRPAEGRPTVVELQSTLRVDRDSCEEAIGQLLYAQRLVLVPKDEANGIYELASLDGPRMREALTAPPVRTVEEILRRPALPQPVCAMVPLGPTPAVMAINALRPFLAGGGSTTITLSMAPAAGNTLLITGLQCEVARVIGLLQHARLEGERAAAAAARGAADDGGDDGGGGAGAGPADAPELAAARSRPAEPVLERLAAIERTLRRLEERIAALEKAATGSR